MNFLLPVGGAKILKRTDKSLSDKRRKVLSAGYRSNSKRQEKNSLNACGDENNFCDSSVIHTHLWINLFISSVPRLQRPLSHVAYNISGEDYEMIEIGNFAG
jgi:hypothetical protein